MTYTQMFIARLLVIVKTRNNPNVEVNKLIVLYSYIRQRECILKSLCGVKEGKQNRVILYDSMYIKF